MSQILRPSVNRFRLGSVLITTILDGSHHRTPLRPPFGLDKSDAELEAIGRANRLPWDGFEGSYSLTLVQTERDLVLFDVGFGEGGRAGGAGFLRKRMAEAGYAPGDVTHVALSHVHPDHILGLYEEGALAFPNAAHLIGRREFDEWTKGDLIPEQRAQNREMFQRLVSPLADRLTFLEDGQTVVSGITAEAGFGHSVGHMMYRIESGGRQLLIWGDICNHYVYSMQHPKSSVGYDDDKEMAIATRLRVLDRAAADDLMVAGFHMPFPAIVYVERAGAAFRWAPASYQMWL